MTQRIVLLSVCLAANVAAGMPLAAQEALAKDPAKGQAKGPGGETICGPRAKLLARLEHGRDFTAQGQGLRDAEAMIEIRADRDGNWLLLQNYADGLSCLLAMCEAWEGARPSASQLAGQEKPPAALPPVGKTDPA
ncbi:hypothetical protein M3484_19170 [Pseudomonas sp. GX19020]|uniref:hypothetical protein n=1 Tax=Pseudomonas sp. GX19020 TaxID=2942277 RepID=UPI0020185C95|nr:hypothetical protein [Pseudomonas sp. GX19020]MCL4068691.1 hypothetical protein [Pseudomonas sp. GX19020]